MCVCFLFFSFFFKNQVTKYKYLGIWLDNTLSFSLQAKIKAKLAFLFRMRSTSTPFAKLAPVKMTIFTLLDYGDVIYRTACESALGKLDSLYHPGFPLQNTRLPALFLCQLALPAHPANHPLVHVHL